MSEAETASNTPDPAAMEILQALASGDESAVSPDAMLQKLAAQSPDPTTTMLASLLMNGMEEEEENPVDDDMDEIERLLAYAESNDLDDDGDDPDASEELEALREVNDTLAAALGACPKCWGGDDGCADCGGSGSPGAAVPDSQLFNHLILPAVRRVNQARRPRPRPAGPFRNPATKEVHHG